MRPNSLFAHCFVHSLTSYTEVVLNRDDLTDLKHNLNRIKSKFKLFREMRTRPDFDKAQESKYFVDIREHVDAIHNKFGLQADPSWASGFRCDTGSTPEDNRAPPSRPSEHNFYVVANEKAYVAPVLVGPNEKVHGWTLAVFAKRRLQPNEVVCQFKNLRPTQQETAYTVWATSTKIAGAEKQRVRGSYGPKSMSVAPFVTYSCDANCVLYDDPSYEFAYDEEVETRGFNLLVLAKEVGTLSHSAPSPPTNPRHTRHIHGYPSLVPFIAAPPYLAITRST